MAQKAGPQQTASLEEVLRSILYEQEALRRILVRKGLISGGPGGDQGCKAGVGGDTSRSMGGIGFFYMDVLEGAVYSLAKQYRGIVILSGLILFFIGCASVPIAPQNMDIAAKRFEPPEGKVNIYVVRVSALGFAAIFQVVVDGKIRGALAYNTYLLFQEDPGKHTITVLTAENMQSVTLNTEAGHNYFLEIGAKIGFMSPQAWIEPLDGEKGRKAVLETSMVQELESPTVNVEQGQGR